MCSSVTPCSEAMVFSWEEIQSHAAKDGVTTQEPDTIIWFNCMILNFSVQKDRREFKTPNSFQITTRTWFQKLNIQPCTSAGLAPSPGRLSAFTVTTRVPGRTSMSAQVLTSVMPFISRVKADSPSDSHRTGPQG